MKTLPSWSPMEGTILSVAMYYWCNLSEVLLVVWYQQIDRLSDRNHITLPNIRRPTLNNRQLSSNSQIEKSSYKAPSVAPSPWSIPHPNIDKKHNQTHFRKNKNTDFSLNIPESIVIYYIIFKNYFWVSWSLKANTNKPNSKHQNTFNPNANIF